MIGSLDPNDLIFPLESRFHVIKHFSILIDDEVTALTSSGILQKDIFNRLKKPGSKFKPGFASSTNKLIQRLKENNTYLIRFQNKHTDRIEIQYEFIYSFYPEGIGWDNLIEIGQIKNIQEIHTEKRNGFPIHYCRKIPEKTWTLNLILLVTENGQQISTIFPGTYAPPYPNRKEHTEELYKTSVEFWEKHALLY